MPWNDVRVQCRFDVAKDLVIDALSPGDHQHRVAENSHVVEKLPALTAGQCVEIGHDRIGQQQAVNLGDLRIASTAPPDACARHPRERTWRAASTCR